jgi:Acyl-protein synthetase, LuxE
MNIYEEVLSFIRTPEPALFDPLALRVFHHQFRGVPPYQRYCLERGATPDTVTSVDEVPPMSTLAFKYARIESAAEPVPASARIFLTSGTTLGKEERGRHLVPHPEVYRSSALSHIGRMLFPDRRKMRVLALHPTADRMPESSFAQMISWCIEEFGEGQALCVADADRVHLAEAIEFLDLSARDSLPVCIMGTTAAFALLFDRLRASRGPLLLPEGSRMMDTGGAKGQIVPLSADEVVEEGGRLLGIPAPLIVNEYGMTEMCSQLYDATPFNSHLGVAAGRRIKLAPPWLRSAALDPISLKPVPHGEIGLLAFFDLANVGSVSALMTEDLGVVDGEAVLVLGRAALSDPRGCALAIEQFAAREPTREPGRLP